MVEGGAVVRLMRQYPNLWADLSPAAGSGYNALARDPDYAVKFLHEFQDRLVRAGVELDWSKLAAG